MTIVRDWLHFAERGVWTWFHEMRIDCFHKTHNFDILGASIFPFPLLQRKGK